MIFRQNIWKARGGSHNTKQNSHSVESELLSKFGNISLDQQNASQQSLDAQQAANPQTRGVITNDTEDLTPQPKQTTNGDQISQSNGHQKQESNKQRSKKQKHRNQQNPHVQSQSTLASQQIVQPVNVNSDQSAEGTMNVSWTSTKQRVFVFVVV